jgi:hypothetical protein
MIDPNVVLRGSDVIVTGAIARTEQPACGGLGFTRIFVAEAPTRGVSPARQRR